MTTLHLRIPETGIDPGQMVAWSLSGKDASAQRSGQALLADIAKADRIEAVLPASAVLLTNVKVPPARGAKLRQLLPFAVEEQILQDPEQVHVAAGPRQADGSTPVAVVEKTWLRSSLDALKHAGLQPQRVVVETLLPSFEPGSWVLIWDGANSFVRTGTHSGFAVNASDSVIPPLELAQALKASRDAQAVPQPIVVRPLAGTSAANLPNVDAWAAALGTSVVMDREWELGGTLPQPSNIDLLQGDFAPSLGVKELLPRLKPVLILAALIGLLQLGAMGFDWWRLSREKLALENSMLQTVRGVFPEAKIEKDTVEAVLQSRINALRNSSGEMTAGDFLPLMQALAPMLRASPQIKVKTLSYQEGELRADLTLPDEASANALRAQTLPPPLQLSVEAVNRTGDVSQARIVLRAKRT